MRQKLEKHEKQMAKLQQALTDIETALSDPAIYQDDAKSKLTSLLAQQGPLKNELEQVELEWMDISEQLEQMEQQFAAEVATQD